MYGCCDPDVLCRQQTVLTRGRLSGDVKPQPAVCHQPTVSHLENTWKKRLGLGYFLINGDWKGKDWRLRHVWASDLQTNKWQWVFQWIYTINENSTDKTQINKVVLPARTLISQVACPAISFLETVICVSTAEPKSADISETLLEML